MKEATHQRVVTGWYLYGFHRTAREVSADGNCAHWIKSSSEMEAFIGWVALQRLILEDNACLLFDRKVAKVKDPYIRMCWLIRRLLKAGWLLPIVGFHCHFRPYISTLNWWRSFPFFFFFFFFFSKFHFNMFNCCGIHRCKSLHRIRWIIYSNSFNPFISFRLIIPFG